ncbi:hypothetical protein P43SY_009489 [Pythium insidiosum]|uniref:EF-hand domain-containing protein n=1 Tax=Pythium insidiosum TaxID=114742 RepID=A0AAD5MAF5_PYTIN|nr:hypothetical protein P43SY_009489 [Pythium insidiosum]
MRWYLSFLPETAVISFCREVEYSTAIYQGGALTEIAGNRLAVRAEMRKAMLLSAAEAPASASASATSALAPTGRAPRIVVDVHRLLLLLLHALEQRRDVMEKELIALFATADVNHDCVLTLDEFKDVIRARMPHFSDRRILRMFREALMGSSDQSFALSMAAFVSVCNDHGLVALLGDDRWQDPFAKAADGKAVRNRRVEKGDREERTEPPAPPKATEEIPEELPVELTVRTPRAQEVEEEEEEETDYKAEQGEGEEELWQW